MNRNFNLETENIKSIFEPILSTNFFGMLFYQLLLLILSNKTKINKIKVLLLVSFYTI